MTFKVSFLIATAFGLLIIGCSTAQRFVALPEGVEASTVARDTIAITAKHFDFEPNVIRVKVGTLVHMNLLSIDGTHGFRLSDFGIDERLDENIPKSVDIFFSEKGEYSFRCSHFCGLGHFGMSGKIIAE